MKIRFTSMIILLGLLLSACSLSLAEDITPPPGYQSPTPAPTLGAPDPTQLSSPPQVSITAPAGVGNVTGMVVNASGGDLPEGTNVTLHGIDINQAGSSKEVINVNERVGSDGSYVFKNVEIPAGRIFLVEVESAGIYIQSDSVTIQAGVEQVSLPPVKIYTTTRELSGLSFDQMHFFLDFSEQNSILLYEIFIVTNPGDQTVRVATDGSSLPFVQTPEGATPMGIEITQDSAPLLAADDGFAIPPGEQSYGFVALFLLPYQKKAELSQSFALPASALTIFAPQGVKVRGRELNKGEPSTFGSQVYDVYRLGGIPANQTLTLSISGTPRTSGSSSLDAQTGLIIGLGVTGLALIGVGVSLFLRDRKQVKAGKEEASKEEPFAGDSEAIMDAIITLDDQFKDRAISKGAYEKRRREMMERLKELLQ